MDCRVYVDGIRRVDELSPAAALAEVRRGRNGFVWIGLSEPDARQLHGIAPVYGLHELAVEDAVTAHQRPKLDHYGDMLFMVLKTVHYVAHDSPATASDIVESGEIMAFVGRDYIVTVRHGDHSDLHGLRDELEADPERLRLGPSSVLHGIADRVVDHYVAVSEAVQRDLDVLETVVFAPQDKIGTEQMYLMKREVLEFRRAVTPLARPLRWLAEVENPFVHHEVRSYFRDVEDHHVTVAERVTSFDQMLTNLLDATIAKIQLRQNTDMRKITAWAAIIAAPTMVTGVYGMNFDNMPGVHAQWGYPVVMIGMTAVCVVLYRVFRNNDWL
jgi:magnesium transporter